MSKRRRICNIGALGLRTHTPGPALRPHTTRGAKGRGAPVQHAAGGGTVEGNGGPREPKPSELERAGALRCRRHCRLRVQDVHRLRAGHGGGTADPAGLGAGERVPHSRDRERPQPVPG